MHQPPLISSGRLVEHLLCQLSHTHILASSRDPLLLCVLELIEEETVRLAVDPVVPAQLSVDIDPTLPSARFRLSPAIHGWVCLHPKSLDVFPGGDILAMHKVCTSARR